MGIETRTGKYRQQKFRFSDIFVHGYFVYVTISSTTRHFRPQKIQFFAPLGELLYANGVLYGGEEGRESSLLTVVDIWYNSIIAPMHRPNPETLKASTPAQGYSLSYVLFDAACSRVQSLICAL